MEPLNRTIIPIILPLFSCHFVELPESREECSTNNSSICAQCPILGRFFFGGGLDEFESLGHIVSIGQWIFTVIIGIFGTFTNCLIITILNRQNSGRTFDILLIALACIDLLGSFTSVIAATSSVAIFENWNRGVIGLYLVYFGTFTAFMARSGSSFMTVLITVERWLVITFPIASSNWFTATKTKLMAAGIFVFAFCMAMPRFTSFAIKPNDFGQDIPSLAELDYVILSTALEKFWYHQAGGFFDKIDFWFPLPTLLFFNILVFIQIRKFSKRRKELNMKQLKDIRAVKMFLPVVIALFLCNIIPYVHYFYIVKGFVYREFFVGVFLSIAVNSAVNLPIYYFKGSSFRHEVRSLFSNCFCCRLFCQPEAKDVNEMSTNVISVSQSQYENKAGTRKSVDFL